MRARTTSQSAPLLVPGIPLPVVLLLIVASPAADRTAATRPGARDVAEAAESGPMDVDRGILRQRVGLDRRGFSPGVIDGAWGSKTGAALAAYQEAEGLAVSGRPDGPTDERLGLRGYMRGRGT